MLRKDLMLALRNIRRDGLYSLIKIGGLAIGFATSIVLFLYVYYQFSYDKHFKDGDRIYRVNMSHIWRPGGGVFHSTGPAVAFAMKEEFPEIEEILRINTPGQYTIRHADREGNSKAFNEKFSNVFAADSTFFSFFDIPLKEGNPATALLGRDKVVLSEEAARKFFGDEPALGKLLQLGNPGSEIADGGEPTSYDYHLVEVTGVAKKLPKNMHFHFDYLLSMATNPNVKRFEWSWIWTQVVTYVKVKPGTDVTAFEEKLHHFGDRHAPATFKKIGMDYEEFVKEKGNWSLFLQPVRDIHLKSGSMSDPSAVGNRLGPTGDIGFVYTMASVGFFILIIAIINFVNLSTARAANRAKEVGVRKTLGVSRTSMMMQFQMEHILIALVAVLIGLGIMELLRLLLMPLNIYIPLTEVNPFLFGLLIILFAIIAGFMAGLYPAFYLTRFKPAEVLKGKVATGFRSGGLRNGLVILQFSIAIALMAGTLIVFQQLNYFLSADIGFDKENLLVINRGSVLNEKVQTFRDELTRIPEVVSACVSTDFRNGAEDIFTKESDDRKITLSMYKIDDYFVSTMGLDVSAGRAHTESSVANRAGVIINEAAAHSLGWASDEAVGKKIVYVGETNEPREVIGVLKDFHFQSLHQNLVPTIFYHIDAPVWGNERILLVRFKADHPQTLISKIERLWDSMADGSPIEISFYDEDYEKHYEAENQMASLFTVFTGLALTIAVIGLVGLVSYSAEQRKKEIGVRKVFGASLFRIFWLINVEYLKLIAIALIIAIPFTWFFMQEWLEKYAYRIEISPLVFVVTGAVAIAFAFACVGYIALRAASLNPSNVLKDE